MFGQLGNGLLCVFLPECETLRPTHLSPLPLRAVDRIRNSSLRNQATDSTCSRGVPPSVPFARSLSIVQLTLDLFGPGDHPRRQYVSSPSLELPTDLDSTDRPTRRNQAHIGDR